MLTPTTTVEEALQNHPQISRALIEYATDCLGCRMARFCTLAEVAQVYQLEWEKFLEALLLTTSPLPKSKGANHEQH